MAERCWTDLIGVAIQLVSIRYAKFVSRLACVVAMCHLVLDCARGAMAPEKPSMLAKRTNMAMCHACAVKPECPSHSNVVVVAMCFLLFFLFEFSTAVKVWMYRTTIASTYVQAQECGAM